MRNLIIECGIVHFRVMKVDHTVWLDFQLGSFEIYITVYSGQMQKAMGQYCFYLYYKGLSIFHLCRVCKVPRIRGVNL